MRPEVRTALADPWFHYCVVAALATADLVEQFDRLYGAALASRATPIERMVDEATGKTRDDMRRFVEFVYDLIYTRVPAPDGWRESVAQVVAAGEGGT